MLILVDTSSWIHFLRSRGDVEVRIRVESALTSGVACWCPPVRLELWNGARGQQEQRVLAEFDRILPDLPITEEIWQCSVDLARNARARGVTIPATDILIAACARQHGAAIEAADSDFDLVASIS